jgi:hypothetical protein
MIIIEMNSNSQAFHALNAATSDPAVYKLRIALDEGQFKIKFNEGLWTADLEGTTVKFSPYVAPGSILQLLRDVGTPQQDALQVIGDIAGTEERAEVKWESTYMTMRIGSYRGWVVEESKLDGWTRVSNKRDGHEGATFATLEVALKAIDAEVAANA